MGHSGGVRPTFDKADTELTGFYSAPKINSPESRLYISILKRHCCRLLLLLIGTRKLLKLASIIV